MEAEDGRGIMCGEAKAVLNGLNVDLSIGYHGGELEIDNREYSCLRGFAPHGRDEVRAFLLRHRKADIVDMVLGFVENAEEA